MKIVVEFDGMRATVETLTTTAHKRLSERPEVHSAVRELLADAIRLARLAGSTTCAVCGGRGTVLRVPDFVFVPCEACGGHGY